MPLKWNAFEVSAFLIEEASHLSLNENTFEVSAIKLLKVKQKRTTEFDQFERCVYANHLRLLTKGILDGYSGYDLS